MDGFLTGFLDDRFLDSSGPHGQPLLMIDSKPLAGWRVLVTRPTDQAQTLANALAAAGATPVMFPTIKLGPPPSWAPFDAAIAHMQGSPTAYAWIVFTSPSAVRFAFDRALNLATLLRAPGAAAVAAVGTETAKTLAGYRVRVALVPGDQRQEGLVASFDGLAAGTRVLFPQTLGGRELLRETLANAGAVVDVVAVSETTALPLEFPPPFDVATFASPSALRAFVAGLGVAVLTNKLVAVIGPTTREAAREAGVTVHVEPPTPSVVALVTALGAYRGLA